MGQLDAFFKKMENVIGSITECDLFTAETKQKATACRAHWDQVVNVQRAFTELHVCVSAELGHISTNMPPDNGAAPPPPSPDKAAGDATLRNPLLEPNPPAPVGTAAASTAPHDTLPPMPLAAATAAAVAADGKADADMPTPAPSPKRTAEEEAMACYKEWVKVARVVTVEEKGKGKGKCGSEVQDGVAAA